MAAQQCDDTLFRLSGRNDKQNQSVNLTLDRLHDSERRAEGAAAVTELNPCSSPVLQSCEENEKQLKAAAAAAAARRRCRVDARQQEDFQITIVINCSVLLQKEKTTRKKKDCSLQSIWHFAFTLPSGTEEGFQTGEMLVKTPHSSGSYSSPVSSVFFCGF